MQGGAAGTDNDLNRLSAAAGGLARFRSAPPSWVDALLEDDDSLKLSGPHHPPSTTAPSALTHLLTSGTTTTTHYIPDPDPDPGYFQGGGGAQQVTSSAFQRMNSSPAEFLSGNVDGYFSSYGYDFVGATSTGDVDVSPCGKRRRDNHHNSDQPSPSFPCHHGHGRGEQLSATASGLLDLEMDKLLDDSVPCRVRAKRGCATHPRSIAERVRRTRISDRIRKLQELVPNMDKQTNTADMLEEAVEYVKTLQRQIQDLTELQKKCRCMEKS